MAGTVGTAPGGEEERTHGTARHSELGRRIEGISDKMLTQTLRDLQRNGLVARTDHEQIPPRVDYALTPLGERLQRTVTQLCGWVVEHMPEVHAAQATFDAAPQPDAPWQRATAGRSGPG
jgi:DNA-binding HxlR family transcriptional regulator